VGDFEIPAALELARKYFGRLKRGPREPMPVRTKEVPQLAERRMTAYAETKPRVKIRWHTVAEGHADAFALDLLADILSGKTGRLYKSLVLDGQVANDVDAGQDGMKYEGYFEAEGTAKPGKTPEDVERAIYAEIEKLKTEPVSDRELEKVKNQAAASNYRRLRSNFAILMQLLVRDSQRGWQTINADPPRVQAVTAADIQRVARTYFSPENRTIAIYYTKEAVGGAQADPAVAGLSEEDQAQVKKLRSFLAQAKPEQLRKMLDGMRQQSESVPGEKKAVFAVMLKVLEEHLKTTEGKKE
jgi:predicted Zn-dependent peptidase